jgi:type IV secretory pathway TraG/TraD family ATPase VirD4
MPRDSLDDGLTDEERRIAYWRRLYAKLAAAALFTVLFALVFDAWAFVFLLLLCAIPLAGFALVMQGAKVGIDRINDAIAPRGTAPQRNTHGSAAWASQEDIAAYDLQPFGFDPDRLILGHFGNMPSFKTLQIKTDGHLITVARSRSGKGVSVVLPNLLNYGGSVLCTDPKGENAAITLDYRRRVLKQKVHILDPWGFPKSPTGQGSTLC